MPNKIFGVFSLFNRSAANNSLLEAQLKLFYLMLGANVLKGAIYLFDAVTNHQGDGSGRAIRLMVTSVLMVLVLRRFPKIIYWGIHYAIVGTILHIYYRVFNRDVGTDVVTMQAIFMVLISGFYGLGKKWGTFYAVMAFASLILYHYIPFRWTGLHPLPVNLYVLYVAINCLVIVMSHIYFHAVLYGNLRQSEQLGEKMAELARTRSTFLSTMSHELRTPLNSVIGLAGLLSSDESGDKQKEQLDVLKFSAEGLLTLINDILDINKLEAGRLELEHVPFDLDRLLKNTARGMAFKAEERSLEFILAIDRKIEGRRFFGDAARLTQVIYNLLGNAIKFTERGSVSLRVEVLSSRDNSHNIRFEVKDTGIGIPEDRQKMIFDPFRQAEANTTRKFGGTGLGLSIVKQLVEQFGSEIRLDSVPGAGSLFAFELLMNEDLSPSAKSSGEQEGNQLFDLSGLNLMLAEDNMMNVFFMKQLFKRWNIKADIAENGQEVLNLLHIKNYDVILMDMHMPIMDGIEATRQIRNLPEAMKANTYIIALTASVSDHIQIRVKEYGMNDYLPKPFQLDDLKERLIDRLKKQTT